MRSQAPPSSCRELYRCCRGGVEGAHPSNPKGPRVTKMAKDLVLAPAQLARQIGNLHFRLLPVRDWPVPWVSKRVLASPAMDLPCAAVTVHRLVVEAVVEIIGHSRPALARRICRYQVALLLGRSAGICGAHPQAVRHRRTLIRAIRLQQVRLAVGARGCGWSLSRGEQARACEEESCTNSLHASSIGWE